MVKSRFVFSSTSTCCLCEVKLTAPTGVACEKGLICGMADRADCNARRVRRTFRLVRGGRASGIRPALSPEQLGAA